MGVTTRVEAPLLRYGAAVQAALHAGGAVRAAAGAVRAAAGAADFVAGRDLPWAEGWLASLLSPADLAFHTLGPYAGHHLTLLDLMRSPGTRTTKTFASLVIVARAVQHIRATGEPVMIVTPSSANKATALRDAVWQAFATGAASADQLQILAVVPSVSRPKLWSSPLADDPSLAARNPVVTFGGGPPDEVKRLARELVGDAARVWDNAGVRLWHTLDIDNYTPADTVRAYAEHEFAPTVAGRPRLHVHAVSSAFGLLGHALGVRQLAEAGERVEDARYFLVQHLGTPDMVLSLYHGSTGPEHVPVYTLDPVSGLYRQQTDRRFPVTTFAPDEVLDSTFYTRAPATSPQMNALIRATGGGGIVVSLHECLQRYGQVRSMLGGTDVVLPADPRELREWSLVMAMTGVLNGIDRGLVPEDDILIHGTGSYATTDFDPIAEARLTAVAGIDDLRCVLDRAIQAVPRAVVPAVHQRG